MTILSPETHKAMDAYKRALALEEKRRAWLRRLEDSVRAEAAKKAIKGWGWEDILAWYKENDWDGMTEEIARTAVFGRVK